MFSTRALAFSARQSSKSLIRPVLSSSIICQQQRPLSYSSVNLAGHGKRKLLAQDSWTDETFFNFRYWQFNRVAIFMWVVLTFWAAFSGEAIYCDYDPELYTPDLYEQHENGVARWMRKYLMNNQEVEYRAEAFELIRMHNRNLMWQTIQDVQALQHIECSPNVQSGGHYFTGSKNPGHTLALAQYVADNDIRK